jgi:hypothetical protein
MLVKVFFSYAHRDESLRDELEKHLSPLRRSGIIEPWHDRRIVAGEEFDASISQYLETADIILLLISADFLASDYCWEREMQRAMERHESGAARVIPVILHACAWQSSPFGKLLAVPTDGRPVSKWPDQNEAFLNIVEAIRRLCSEIGKAADAPAQRQIFPDVSGAQESIERPRSSNLRIHKIFTDFDRDQFERGAFEFIANFFDATLSELNQRNAEVETDFQRLDATHFLSVAYRGGKAISEMTVWRDVGKLFGGSIAYFRGRNTHGNSMNGCFTVKDDGHTLYLTPLMGMRSHDQAMLSFQGAAEMLWEEFMEPLQRSY